MKILDKMKKKMAHKLKSENGKPREISEEGIKNIREEVEQGSEDLDDS